MSPFRGDDDTLDREIETLEGMAKRRLRRYTADLRSLTDDLRDLKRERAHRRASSAVPAPTGETVPEANSVEG